MTERHRVGADNDRFDPDATIRVFHEQAHQMSSVFTDVDQRPDLIYLDPPFATNRVFTLRLSVDDEDGQQHKRQREAYEDQWEQGLDGYLTFMRSIIREVFESLQADGSLLLHCDQRAVPYLSVACDEVFGRGARVDRKAAGFRAELIWRYGLGGSSKRSYPRKHDNILWYSNSDEWFFQPPMIPATSQRMAGKMKKMPDVIDIPTLNNMAHERCGYPTQKPLELLELFIHAHTKPGDLVADGFAGSGTTAVAAGRLGRNAVVLDQSDDAIAIIRDRIITEVKSVDLMIFRRRDHQWEKESWDTIRSEHIVWRSYPGVLEEGRFIQRDAGNIRLVRTLEGKEFIAV